MDFTLLKLEASLFISDCYTVLLCSGAVGWDSFHSSQPGRVLEVYVKHNRPAAGLPLQPGLYELSRASHQRPDLGVRWWRRDQHAVSAQRHLVKCDACCISGSTTGVLSFVYVICVCLSYFRNAEQNKCLWKLSDISEKSENEGRTQFLSRNRKK